jgi:hypothetical protein
LPTRRSVLAAAAGVVGGVPLVAAAGSPATAAPSAGGAVAGAGGAVTGGAIPQTLARRGGTGVAATAYPLSHLAVSWTGAGTPGVRTRTAAGWGAWRGLDACHGGRDGVTAERRAALLVTPGAVGYEVAARGDVSGLATTELNTVSGPARAVAAPAQSELRHGGFVAPVRYLSRAGWGADESLRFAPDGTEVWPPEFFPVQTLTVHHTAGINDDPDPAATVRAIYFFHCITQGFGDVGYHLLVDEAGTVYEGRWSGTDAVPVFGPELGPDNRPLMVNAGHALGFNAGNIGVALLGDFTSQLPKRSARRSLTLVLGLLAAVERLNPTGITDYVNPISGATATVNTIAGHRDWNPTECPGNTFYPQLPSLRRDVKRLLGGRH